MEMNEYGNKKQSIETNVNQKVEQAKEMRAEAEAFKSGMEGMPGGLDAEIASAIEGALGSGRQEAMSDVSGVEQEAAQDQQEAAQVKGEVDAKIQENESARAKLDSVKSNKYGKGVDSAIGAIESNNAQGEQIKSELEQAMQQAMAEIAAAKEGI